MCSLRKEDGFTLTELIVSVVLLAVVVTVSYAGLFSIRKGAQISDRQAAFTGEVSTPLLMIDKVLVQNSSIEDAGPYSIRVLTDRDLDNLVERNIITAGSDGTLRLEIYELDSGRTAVLSTIQDWTMSTSNRNVAEGIPLFRYYNMFVSEIPTPSAVSSDARSVRVRVVSENQGHLVEDSRTIQFRLRQY